MDILEFYEWLPDEDKVKLRNYIAEKERVAAGTLLAPLTRLDDWAEQNRDRISGRLYAGLRNIDDAYFETVSARRLLLSRNLGRISVDEFQRIRGY